MSNAAKVLQALLVYAICVPLALILGYMVATPLDMTSLGTVGLVFLALSVPLLLRAHHLLLVFFWNASMVAFFLPGKPRVAFLLVLLSLGASVLQRALDRQARFISVPSLTWPLVALAAVVFGTAELRGGFGFRSLGGSVYGGQKYFLIMLGILCYFALTARRIPPERRGLYVAVLFFSGLANIIGDLYPYSPGWSLPLFAFFPPSMTWTNPRNELMRLGGTTAAAYFCLCFMLARYGVRGIFRVGKPFRLLLFGLLFFTSMLGGFRSALLSFALMFGVMFYLERLYRTHLLVVLTLVAILVGPPMIIFARHMPLSVQRTLAILPIDVDPVARADAENSSEWRVKLWTALLPQVPEYLLLGKGYALSVRDAQFGQMEQAGTVHAFSEDQQGLALASDFHNGPLSILIPLGIWGMLAFLWFLFAAGRVLYKNYQYSAPENRTVNIYLLAIFIAKVVMFFFVVGALNWDLMEFCFLAGFSLSFNGGVLEPELAQAPAVVARPRAIGTLAFRPRPALSRVEG